MKKIEEKVVPENANIVATIIQLAEENKSWIYISFDLLMRLMRNYYHHSYASSQKGTIFETSDSFDDDLYVDQDDAWNRVSIVPKKDVYIANDPDVIYFLS